MTRLIAAIAICVVPLMACAPAPSSQPAAPVMDSPEDIAAIGKIREAAMAAYTGGDADALANLYTENAVSEPNNGPTLNGRSAIAASLKGTFERSSMKVTLVPDQTKTTGSTGFEAGHYTAEVTPKSGAASTTVEGRYMMLLTKGSDGSWKVAYDMDNVGQPSTPATAAATEPAK